MEQIQYLLDKYQLSATEFADKLGVQRSTISHLLSGRNKPSLDLLLKIINNFPGISEAWLLTGNGNPFRIAHSSFNDEIKTSDESNTTVNRIESKDESTFVNTENESLQKETHVSQKETNDTFVNNYDIEQILVFYKDGTFKYFRPRT